MSQGPDVLTEVISYQKLTPAEDLVDLCCLQVAILQLNSQEKLWVMDFFLVEQRGSPPGKTIFTEH